LIDKFTDWLAGWLADFLMINTDNQYINECSNNWHYFSFFLTYLLAYSSQKSLAQYDVDPGVDGLVEAGQSHGYQPKQRRVVVLRLH
jgi:hypothetical protein